MQSSDNLSRLVGRGVLRPADPSRDRSSPTMSLGCAAMPLRGWANAYLTKCPNRSRCLSRERVWDAGDGLPKHSSHFRTMVVDLICNLEKKQKNYSRSIFQNKLRCIGRYESKIDRLKIGLLKAIIFFPTSWR